MKTPNMHKIADVEAKRPTVIADINMFKNNNFIIADGLRVLKARQAGRHFSIGALIAAVTCSRGGPNSEAWD